MKPYIIINSAMSADGKIATKERKQLKISGKDDFKRVDILKTHVDAIMVGINTVISDDPSLTIKSEDNIKIVKLKKKYPIRIVVDSKCSIDLNAQILQKGEGERIILTSKSCNPEKVELLKKKFKVIICGENSVDLAKSMDILYNMGIKILLVEGGATINYSLIKQKLVNEIYTYIGNCIIGGVSAPTLVDGLGFSKDEIIKLKLISIERIDDGLLVKWDVLY